MDIRPVRLRALRPPQDDLFEAIVQSNLRLQERDVVAVSSKVVSIDEGRCVPADSTDKQLLARQESQYYTAEKPRWGSRFTLTQGVLIRAAGIDESNGNGYYTLWPLRPQYSAARLRRELMNHYGIKSLGVLVTDSISTPLRRGAIGFALAWAGFEPLYDYRGKKDIFGRKLQYEQSNVADALAAAAVLMMGEGSERTPLALIRNAPEKIWNRKHRADSFIVPLKEDLFAMFLTKAVWKKGGSAVKRK
jgi:coenzyme F420-0:L-glutamate ligase